MKPEEISKQFKEWNESRWPKSGLVWGFGGLLIFWTALSSSGFEGAAKFALYGGFSAFAIWFASEERSPKLEFLVGGMLIGLVFYVLGTGMLIPS